MSYVLGLTGSIAMGKSTTSALFAAEGLPVWDADAVVHRLYAQGGAAVAPLAAAFPEALADGAISRPTLARITAADPGALPRIEAVVHPLVAADRAGFLAGATADIVVLDVPLLFETGTDALCDGIAVVSVPEAVQRDRALARPGMDGMRLAMMLARQIPDAEKRARATWVIETLTLDAARARVRAIIAAIRKGGIDA
ncbi:MAG: dephospho-CoA kinase [Rubellimicrobium sp.]|nr:dephospho-CoA kinase [Rubellimicrobium sp.]